MRRFILYTSLIPLGKLHQGWDWRGMKHVQGIYIYICVCVYVYMCVCIYIYIYIRQGQRIFPLASVSRPVLGPTQPPVRWVPGVLSPGVKRGRGVTLTTHPHLGPGSWMSRSYTSSPPSASMACSGTALLIYMLCTQNFDWKSTSESWRRWEDNWKYK
jgi:hypothetical protein